MSYKNVSIAQYKMAENIETIEAFEPKVEHYELAFHLRPDLEEVESKDKARKLEEALTALGGQIALSREPKKQHLSYPINHQKYGYFGTISFRAPTDEIIKLDSQLKLDGDILRFMLVKTLENPRTMRGVSGKEHGPRARKAAMEVKPAEVVKPEVMEKQLEEVIGKMELGSE